ncbi:uncharacterized protein LOC133188975 [Saccostrea echinata]|uniref:uncharacterized protein LOC133188975 n=1 Tax=Saccostrea echinata TaxID=191078 RepID=UPI002A8388A2|nr:uncharacterized protein LOC133188975 [Saccostrea echinata]
MKEKNCKPLKVVYYARKDKNGLLKDRLRRHNFNQINGKAPRCASSSGNMEVKSKTYIILELLIQYIKELKNRNVMILTLEEYNTRMGVMCKILNQRIQALEKKISFTEEATK